MTAGLPEPTMPSFAYDLGRNIKQADFMNPTPRESIIMLLAADPDDLPPHLVRKRARIAELTGLLGRSTTAAMSIPFLGPAGVLAIKAPDTAGMVIGSAMRPRTPHQQSKSDHRSLLYQLIPGYSGYSMGRRINSETDFDSDFLRKVEKLEKLQDLPEKGRKRLNLYKSRLRSAAGV